MLEQQLGHALVRIRLRVVRRGVAVMVQPVNDALHVALHHSVVISEQHLQGLHVDVPRVVAVNRDLVVVARLQHRVKNRLVELVLDQEVRLGVLLKRLYYLCTYDK